jgi:tetratricopeptide (TPR) repeat protein
MHDGTTPAVPEGSILLEYRDDHEWEFAYPRITEDALDGLDEGIELMHADRRDEAERLFLRLIRHFPEFIDARHHLAMLLDAEGRKTEAFRLWQEAVDLGFTCFPLAFKYGQDLLPWGWIDNRPFLRACHGFGLAYLARGNVGMALDVFRRILALNPDDNLGIRALVIDCYFSLKRPGEVLAVCAEYAGDSMEQSLYGKALALFQLGPLDEARETLRQAVEELPLVAQELLKTRHRRPKSRVPGHVALGGADQAYEYWREQGRFWNETPGSIEWVRAVLGEQHY